jgi:hypothetical protein
MYDNWNMIDKYVLNLLSTIKTKYNRNFVPFDVFNNNTLISERKTDINLTI